MEFGELGSASKRDGLVSTTAELASAAEFAADVATDSALDGSCEKDRGVGGETKVTGEGSTG